MDVLPIHLPTGYSHVVVTSLAVSPTGNYALTLEFTSNALRCATSMVMDARLERVVSTWYVGLGARAMGFSAGGESVVVRDRGRCEISMFNALNGVEIVRLPGVVAASLNAAQSALTLGLGHGGGIDVMDLLTFRTTHHGPFAGAPKALAMSPTGRLLLAVVASDPFGEPDATTLRVRFADSRWDCLSKAMPETTHVVWSPNGTQLACFTRNGGDVVILDMLAPPPFHECPVPVPDWASVQACLWSPDGTRLVAVCHGGVFVFDQFARQFVFSDGDALDLPVAGAWSPDGARIAVRMISGTVRVLRASDGGRLMDVTPQMSGGAAVNMAFSPDSSTLVLALANAALARIGMLTLI